MKRIRDVEPQLLSAACRQSIVQSLNLNAKIVGAQAVMECSQISLASKGWGYSCPSDFEQVREATALSLLNLMRSGLVCGQVGPGAVTTYTLTSSRPSTPTFPQRSGALRPAVQVIALSACLAGCATQTMYQTPRYSYFVQPSSLKAASVEAPKVATVKTPADPISVTVQDAITLEWPPHVTVSIASNTAHSGAPLKQPSTGANLVATTQSVGLSQPAQQEQKVEQAALSVQSPAAATTSYLPLKKSVYFEFGKSNVHADMREVVKSMLPLARVAKSFKVTGVTDGFGDRAINESLAKSRAQAVAQALGSFGVNAERIDVQACTTASCWQRSAGGVIAHRLNRRVDIEVMVPRSIAMGLRDQFVDIENVVLARSGPAEQRG